MSAVISGVGIYVPDNILTNADLEKLVDTSDQWITERTGIRERRILPEGSGLKASDLGARAARNALTRAGIGANELDGIIAAGLNPDKQWPAMACSIQKKISAAGFAFDVTAACAGFVYAVNMASLMIRSGQCRHILVVGAELISPIVDWKDRSTCVLFGDGAGAVVISHSDDESRGVFYSALESDGGAEDILYLETGTGRPPTIQMDGKKVFKLAVHSLAGIIERCLSEQSLSIKDIKMAFFHQANVRILEAVAKRLGLPEEKILINLSRYGNTSSASIPLALYEAVESKRLNPGDLVFFAAIGGGMSWGCNLVRW